MISSKTCPPTLVFAMQACYQSEEGSVAEDRRDVERVQAQGSEIEVFSFFETAARFETACPDAKLRAIALRLCVLLLSST